MESFHNKQDTNKKNFDKQPSISSSSSTTTDSPRQHQDTNYIGITINDDSSRQEYLPETEPYSPIYQSPHSLPPSSSIQLNRVLLEEDSPTYIVQTEMSGAFLKIKTQADLPMSHHRRAREGKRYGVKYINIHLLVVL